MVCHGSRRSVSPASGPTLVSERFGATIAPRTGELTGPVIVVACNRKTCHTATGGGRLPIVNVPFSLGRKAAGAPTAPSTAPSAAAATGARGRRPGA